MTHRRLGPFFKPALLMLLCFSLLVSYSYAKDNTATAPIGLIAEPTVGADAICPAAPVQIPLNKRVSLENLISLSDNRFYKVADTKIAQVTPRGLIIPVSKGSTEVKVTVIAEEQNAVTAMKETLSQQPTSCSIPIQVVEAIPYKGTLKANNEIRKVKVGSKSFAVQVVNIPKGLPVDIGLAKNAVGNVDHLKTIADSRKADTAINGTYFEAYGGIPEPWGTLIVNGEAAHVTHMGTTIGFTLEGTAKMADLRIKIEGGTEGSYSWPNNWYAYFINRTPPKGGTSSYLFTPARGSRIGFDYGTAITVKDGLVTRITENENVAIPKDGFVIVLNGTEKANLVKRFEIGKKVHYRLLFQDAESNPIAWDDVVTAVGAGPRVVKDGKVFIQAESEGFKEAKILTAAASRSGIGIKADGSIVLVTVGKATIKELGGILRALGAIQAMNLDGGASSGLYANGKMLTMPGRLISNSLLFGTELKFKP